MRRIKSIRITYDAKYSLLAELSWELPPSVQTTTDATSDMSASEDYDGGRVLSSQLFQGYLEIEWMLWILWTSCYIIFP